MGFTKMQITDTIFPCSTDCLFAGLRYMQVRDHLEHSNSCQVGATGGEGFALPFAGTDPHNGDENENVGDEDNE